MMKKVLLPLFVWASIVSFAFGQGSAGMTGIVADQSGAVVPGVTVTAVEVETGLTRTTVSNNSGMYRLPNLNPGQYTIQAVMTGFSTFLRSGITLKVGDQLGLDMVMRVGAASEKIEVTGEASLVETTTSVVGGVVDNRAVQSLPLNGRGFADLAVLEPNVVLDDTAQRKGNIGFGIKLSIAGMRSQSNNYTLDGQDVNSLFNDLGNVSGAAAGVDSIREFKVVTNPYSADIGRTAGGEIQVITKSGTNSFHGSVYEFLRNDKVDANQWEANAFGGGVKPAFRRNQFGASLGGPIVKDKTMFFVNYEGLRTIVGNTMVFVVPDVNAHAGFLPDSRGVSQFVGVAPNVKPYLDLYPIPTNTLGNGTGQSSFQGSAATNDNFFLVRGDHVVSSSHQLFARYAQDSGRQEAPSDFLFNNFQNAATKFAALGLTSILSPRVVNSLSLFYNRSTSLNGDIPARLKNPSLFTMSDQKAPEGPIYGNITVTGLVVGPSAQLGATNVLTGVYYNVSQLRDTMSLEAGRHTLNFGTNLEYMQPNTFNSQFAGGNFSFLNLQTFMQGTAQSVQAVIPGSRSFLTNTQWIVAFHVQDDFRVSSRLTLNMGMRYEMTTVPTERYNRFATVRDYASINQTFATIMKDGPPFYNNPSLHNFAPRVGFAWSPNQKTSIRAGAGLFDSLLTAHYWRPAMAYNPPYYSNGTINASAGIPIDFPNAYFTQARLLGGLLSTNGIAFNVSQPTAAQYSFSVQRQLGSSRVVNVGYVGSRGWHLTRDLGNTNVRIPTVLSDGRLFYGTDSASVPVRNPAVGSIRVKLTDINSFFNSFFASFEQKYSAGLNFQLSYTFARSIDDSSRSIGSADFITTEGGSRYALAPPSDQRGLSSFDVRNTVSMHITYDLPWGAGRVHPINGVAGKLLGGWSANSLVRLTGGSPFGPQGDRDSSAVNRTTYGALSSGPPNVVGKSNSIHPQNAAQYFDPKVFALPDPGFYGNAGRNIITGPGTASVDFSLSKDTRLTENINLQFRGELFNVFNRVNFYPPSGNLFDTRSFQYLPNAGQLTSSKPSRQIQFALKLIF